jgi:CheY-like chemotaxis protein
MVNTTSLWRPRKWLLHAFDQVSLEAKTNVHRAVPNPLHGVHLAALRSLDVARDRHSGRIRIPGQAHTHAHPSLKPGQRGLRKLTPRPTVLCIGGDARCREMLLRICRRLEHVHLVVTDRIGEGRLLAVSLTPSLILLDAQLPACEARELLAYLGRASLTAATPLAVLLGSEESWSIRLCRSKIA